MSNLVFEKLAQVLTAGQVWRLTIGADFFRIAACAWPLKIRILKAGRIMGEMEGWQAGDYLRGVDFDAVEIENGSQPQAVTVQIAGGGVGSDRVIGEVSVIDGSERETLAGKAFFSNGYCQAVAGQYPHCLLRNSAASGKAIVISSIAIRSASASGISMKRHDVALSTVTAEIVAKRFGAGVGVAETSWQSSVAVIGAGTNAFSVKIPANETFEVQLKEPIWLDSGVGILAVGTLAADLGMVAQFREIDV